MNTASAWRTILKAVCVFVLLAPAQALDKTPFPSFAYEGQQITRAVIMAVDTNGVTLLGRDAHGQERALVVPLLAAQKMVLLNRKASAEIEAALKEQRAAEAEKRYAEFRLRNAGQEFAFDLHEKTSAGWVGHLCERVRVQTSRGTRSSAQRTGFASGEYVPASFKEEWQTGSQMVLVRYYGRPAAEGERIITRAEQGDPEEVEVGGFSRTLRAYNVVGEDRAQISAPPSPAPSSAPTAPPVAAAPTDDSAHTITVVTANYGAGDVFKDVSDIVASKVRAGRLDFTANNSEMGGDPVFGKGKELRLVLTVDGQERVLTFNEGEQVSVP